MDKGIRAAVGTANQECREYLLGLGKQLPPYLQSWRMLCHPVSACVTPNCSQCRWYFWKKNTFQSVLKSIENCEDGEIQESCI